MRLRGSELRLIYGALTARVSHYVASISFHTYSCPPFHHPSTLHTPPESYILSGHSFSVTGAIIAIVWTNTEVKHFFFDLIRTFPMFCWIPGFEQTVGTQWILYRSIFNNHCASYHSDGTVNNLKEYWDILENVLICLSFVSNACLCFEGISRILKDHLDKNNIQSPA